MSQKGRKRFRNAQLSWFRQDMPIIMSIRHCETSNKYNFDTTNMSIILTKHLR